MDAKAKIPLTKLAANLGVHRHTLRNYLLRYKIKYKQSRIPDHELDELVKNFRTDNPHSGIRYLTGYLYSNGIRVSRHRLRTSIARVDPLGKLLAKRNTIKRRGEYSVPRPNALWHIDGHHKLILWGIIIHGCVCGYSRAVWQIFELLFTTYHIIRSQASRRAPIIGLRLSSRCFYMPSWSMASRHGAVEITEARTKTYRS